MRADFADRLVERVRALGHPLCVGIDPHLDRLPPLFRPATAENVAAFGRALIDRVAGKVAAVKPQVAFFEQLGWPGLRALEEVVTHARAADLLVVADAKRGDIGSTAKGYANAFLGPDARFPADALTVSPWLGLDTLEPFLERAEATGSGLFVLVKTSNPGAGYLQDRVLANEAADTPAEMVWQHLANALALRAESRVGDTGWSSLGAVVGATTPDDARSAREHLPRSLFLVPGYGAQGGSARDAVAGFVAGPDGDRLEGGLVNSSRGIAFPADADTGDVAAWERAIDAALERAIAELSSIVLI